MSSSSSSACGQTAEGMSPHGGSQPKNMTPDTSDPIASESAVDGDAEAATSGTVVVKRDEFLQKNLQHKSTPKESEEIAKQKGCEKATKDDTVVLRFSRELRWLEMDPVAAIRIGETLKEKGIEVLRGTRK